MSDHDLSALLPYEPAYASCWLGDLRNEDGDPPEFGWVHQGHAVDEATNRLAAWIAGMGPAHRPRGSVLVTGLRGVGKTTLVNLALHRAALALRARSREEDRVPEALLVVWVDCPRSIDAPDLLRRVLRRLYLTAVDQGLSDVEPGLVQQARTAYLRTLGSLKETVSEEWKRTIGFEIEKLTTVKLSWEDEYALSRTLELVAGQASEVECEDELSRLTAAMGAPGFGHRQSLLGRGLEGLRERVARVKKFIGGRRSIAVRPVFVFDELDKVDDPVQVARTLEVLKTLFTSCPAAFIFIAGAKQEAEWLRAEAQVDSVLTSVFAWRLYVPALSDGAALDALVNRHWKVAAPGATAPLVLEPDVKDGLMLWSGGIPKNVVRLLRSQFSVAAAAREPTKLLLQPADEFASRYSWGAETWRTLLGALGDASSPYARDAQRLVACSVHWSKGLAVRVESHRLESIERLEINEQGLLLQRPPLRGAARSSTPAPSGPVRPDDA